MQGQAIDDRSARIAETEQLRDLVECLAGSIVSRVPDILVRPAFVFLLGEIEMRVSSRDHQSQHWKHQFVVSLLALLEENRVNVAFQVIYCD